MKPTKLISRELTPAQDAIIQLIIDIGHDGLDEVLSLSIHASLEGSKDQYLSRRHANAIGVLVDLRAANRI